MVLMVARPGADWYEPEDVEGQNRDSISCMWLWCKVSSVGMGLGQGRASSAAGHPFARPGAGMERYDEATRGVNHVGDHAAEAGVRQCSDRARVASGVLTPPASRRRTPRRRTPRPEWARCRAEPGSLYARGRHTVRWRSKAVNRASWASRTSISSRSEITRCAYASASGTRASFFAAGDTEQIRHGDQDSRLGEHGVHLRLESGGARRDELRAVAHQFPQLACGGRGDPGFGESVHPQQVSQIAGVADVVSSPSCIGIL